jgi:hypothetical protein
MREWVDNHSEFFGDLIHCPYCTSHWVGFAAVIIFQPILFSCGWIVADILLTTFAVVAVSSIVSGMIIKAFSN